MHMHLSGNVCSQGGVATRATGRPALLTCTSDLLEWLEVELLRGARRRRHVTGPNWVGWLCHGRPHQCGAPCWPGHCLHPAVTPTVHQCQAIIGISKGTAHLSHQQTCRARKPATAAFRQHKSLPRRHLNRAQQRVALHGEHCYVVRCSKSIEQRAITRRARCNALAWHDCKPTTYLFRSR